MQQTPHDTRFDQFPSHTSPRTLSLTCTSPHTPLGLTIEGFRPDVVKVNDKALRYDEEGVWRGATWLQEAEAGWDQLVKEAEARQYADPADYVCDFGRHKGTASNSETRHAPPTNTNRP